MLVADCSEDAGAPLLAAVSVSVCITHASLSGASSYTFKEMAYLVIFSFKKHPFKVKTTPQVFIKKGMSIQENCFNRQIKR